MRDPYEVLGVPKKATEAEIKKAFRTLAKKHHPDTHGNAPDKVKKFQEISGAYEVIGDKEKRAQYDRGEIDAAGQPRGFDPGAQGFGGGFRPRTGGRRGGPGESGFQWNSGAGAEGLRAEDIFSDLFGGSRRSRQPQKGQDIQLATTITLEEAASGGSRRVVLGDGKELEVRIPPGVKEGQTIRVRGQGGPGGQGGPPGDVLINVAIAPHASFTRDGRDLKLDLPISLQEAILGGKVPAPTLAGAVSLTVPPHSNSGRTLRLKGKGLPGSGKEEAGDLYVRLVVMLPEPGDKQLDDFIQGWQSAYDPRAKLK